MWVKKTESEQKKTREKIWCSNPETDRRRVNASGCHDGQESQCCGKQGGGQESQHVLIGWTSKKEQKDNKKNKTYLFTDKENEDNADKEDGDKEDGDKRRRKTSDDDGKGEKR